MRINFQCDDCPGDCSDCPFRVDKEPVITIEEEEQDILEDK